MTPSILVVEDEPAILELLKVNLIDSYNAVITFNTNVDTESSVTFGKAGNLDLKAGRQQISDDYIFYRSGERTL